MPDPNITPLLIRQATLSDSEPVADLFDQYRQFYGQPPNLEQATEFIYERLKKCESVILLAFLADQAVGFVQLYPSFSSISMQRVWILNDMLVIPAARQQGIGTQLLKHVRQFAEETDAKAVVLETSPDNTAAQSIYQAIGFTQDTEFLHFSMNL